jgi:hypothetical protein
MIRRRGLCRPRSAAMEKNRRVRWLRRAVACLSSRRFALVSNRLVVKSCRGLSVSDNDSSRLRLFLDASTVRKAERTGKERNARLLFCYSTVASCHHIPSRAIGLHGTLTKDTCVPSALVMCYCQRALGVLQVVCRRFITCALASSSSAVLLTS